ncbi:MAG: hypothetical protein RIT45_2672 [Pseudomonadota bacterium]
MSVAAVASLVATAAVHRPADAVGPAGALGIALAVASLAAAVGAWRERTAWAPTAAPDDGSAGLHLGSGRRLVATVMVAFAAIAFGAYHAYPFYVFDMYSQVYHNANRIVARLDDGHVVEVERFKAVRCDHAPASDWLETPPECPAAQRFASRDRFVAGAVVARADAGLPGDADAFVLVRRIWRFEAAGVRVVDCPLRRCVGRIRR